MIKIRKLLAPLQSLGSERLTLIGVTTGGHAVVHWYQQIFSVVLPSLKAGLGLTDVEVGVLATTRHVAGGGLNFPAGILADTFVRYRAVFLGFAIAVMGAGYLLVGAFPLLLWALIGTVLIGIGGAVWHPTALATLSNRFPERRATAISIHGMGATIADTIAPLAVGGLLVVFYWRWVLALHLIPALVLGLVVWRYLSGSFADTGPRPRQAAQFRAVGNLLKNPSFLGITASMGFMNMGRLVVITFLPIYLQEHLGYSPFVLGVYIALMHVMGTFSQPVMGVLSDQFGRKAVLVPSYVVLGVLFLLLAMTPAGIVLAVLVTAIGALFYPLINIVTAAVMDVAGEKIQASAMGLTMMLGQVIVLPAPIVAGFLIEAYGIEYSFILAGSFVLLATLLLVPLRLYRGRGDERRLSAT